jgi:hypothetical protein
MVDYRDQAPVYVSVRAFNGLINSADLSNVQMLDADTLESLGVSPGNIPSMQSGLRFLGIINDSDTIIDKNLYYLSDHEPEDNRSAAFDRIFVRAYRDLLADIPLNKLTRQNMKDHFLANHASEHVARKAAHFALWFATQAGHDLDERVRLYGMNQLPGLATIDAMREETVDEVNQAIISGLMAHEEKYLTALIDQLAKAEEPDLVEKLVDKIDEVMARMRNSS